MPSGLPQVLMSFVRSLTVAYSPPKKRGTDRMKAARATDQEVRIPASRNTSSIRPGRGDE